MTREQFLAALPPVLASKLRKLPPTYLERLIQPTKEHTK